MAPNRLVMEGVYVVKNVGVFIEPNHVISGTGVASQVAPNPTPNDNVNGITA